MTNDLFIVYLVKHYGQTQLIQVNGQVALFDILNCYWKVENPLSDKRNLNERNQILSLSVGSYYYSLTYGFEVERIL